MMLKWLILLIVINVSLSAVVKKHHVKKRSAEQAGSPPSTRRVVYYHPSPSQNCPCAGWGGDSRGGWRNGPYWGRRPEMLEGRLDGQSARLDLLEEKFKAMEDVVEEKYQKAKNTILEAKSLVQRVDRLEGTGCPSNEFRCSGDIHKCISNILVCDGHKDCDSGDDEDETICRALTPPGTIVEGDIHGPDPCTKRKPTHIRFVITHLYTPHTWYTTHNHVTGAATLTFHRDHERRMETLFVQGYFDFARRRLVIEPPEDDLLSFVCEFDGVHEDFCIGSIRYVPKDEICMQFKMSVTQ